MTPSTAAPWRPLSTGALPVRPLPSVVVSLLTALLMIPADGGVILLTVLGVVGAPIATGLMTIVVQLVLSRMRASPTAAASPPADDLAQLRRRLATLERENARLRGTKRR